MSDSGPGPNLDYFYPISNIRNVKELVQITGGITGGLSGDITGGIIDGLQMEILKLDWTYMRLMPVASTATLQSLSGGLYIFHDFLSGECCLTPLTVVCVK